MNDKRETAHLRASSLVRSGGVGGNASAYATHDQHAKPDYLQSLIKFIPVTLLKYLTNKNRAEGLPDCQRMRTAVLVAEIKHFYDKKNQKFTKQRAE